MVVINYHSKQKSRCRTNNKGRKLKRQDYRKLAQEKAPGERVEFTERILNIANVLASRYAHPNTNAYEELQSAAFEGLVRGALLYDSSFGTVPTTIMWLHANSMVRKHACAETHHPRPKKDGSPGKPHKSHEERWSEVVSLDEKILGTHEYTPRPVDPNLVDSVVAKMSCLTDQERQVIKLLFLEGVAPKDVALKLDISKQRVSQLQIKGLTKLRKAFGIEEEVPEDED